MNAYKNVRCASCRKTIGYSQGEQPVRNNVYCSDWCAGEIPADKLESRNDEWRILVSNGRTPLSVAKLYGITHSLVYRTIKR